MWNNLDQNLRNLESFSAFKNSLIKKSNSNATNVPSVYLSGQRYLSVLHARIRNYCSDLNYDLFSNHLRDDPFCNCILHEYETAEHFILKCRFFKDQRLTLFKPLDNVILLTLLSYCLEELILHMIRMLLYLLQFRISSDSRIYFES